MRLPALMSEPSSPKPVVVRCSSELTQPQFALDIFYLPLKLHPTVSRHPEPTLTRIVHLLPTSNPSTMMKLFSKPYAVSTERVLPRRGVCAWVTCSF